jgi:antitoxin ParD1/3/4
MTNLTISLPDSAQAYIATQISSGRYATADEVLAALIEQAQQRADEASGLDFSGPDFSGPDFSGPEHLRIQSRSQLDDLLTEGLESGESIEVTDGWWEAKRVMLLGHPH